MTTTTIVALIMSMAPMFNVEPKVALAVAAIESSFNANAVGRHGEIGLYQIMPDVGKKYGFTAKELKKPAINIFMGLTLLQAAKNNCIHKKDLDYLVCYNYGVKNARKVKHPNLFPYVKKANQAMQSKAVRFPLGSSK